MVYNIYRKKGKVGDLEMKKKDRDLTMIEPGVGFDYASAFSSINGRIGFQLHNTRKWIVLDFSKKELSVKFVWLKFMMALLRYLDKFLDELNLLYYGDMDLERISEILEREVEEARSREESAIF